MASAKAACVVPINPSPVPQATTTNFQWYQPSPYTYYQPEHVAITLARQGFLKEAHTVLDELFGQYDRRKKEQK